MTLEEAIDIFRADASETILNLSELRSDELAEWLEELATLRKKNKFKPISKIVHCPVCDNPIFADMKHCDRCGAEQERNRSGRMNDMDLKTRAELLPCGQCEDRKEAKEIYQQIRADAIEEVLHKLQELKTGEGCPKGCNCSSKQDKCPYDECNDDVIRIVEQLKEQN